MSEGIVTGLSNPNTPAVAGLCTLFDLREGVFDFLREDDDRAFVTNEMVTAWLNEGYLDLNARLRLKQTTLDATTTAAGLIAVPSDFVEMISLWFDAGIPATVVDDNVFESYSESTGITAQSFVDRILVRFFNNNFETYPIEVSTDYTLRYVARPAALVNLSDQPTAITPELCVRLRKYALAEAWTRYGEGSLSAAAMAEYLEGLPGRPREMHRMHPAPMNLIPAPGPFG